MRKYFKLLSFKNVRFKIYADSYNEAFERAVELSGLSYDDFSYDGVGFD